jgi:U3 small nucleolar ribonucleoprotein protein LCP5
MAASDDLPSELNALIETISSSLANTTSSLPTTVPDAPNGLSLLTLKNNLLLSYLQSLSLLTISKLSHPEFTLQTPESQSIIWNLIQDRVHLEKGVQPLETKIGYQIRKLLRAADDPSNMKTSASREKDESLLFKPNPAALVSAAPAADTETSEAVYRPPKISSTALPTARAEGPRRNKVLEEFIAQTELSNAPTPLPSIGSNLAGIGARNTYKTTRHKDVEQYEEENFIRLPSTIMKEKKGRKERGGMQEFGGEDWSGLQRIGMGKWDFGKREGRVERSRKRGFEEGVGGTGEEVSGQAFEKRKKVLEGRKMRKQKGAKR